MKIDIIRTEMNQVTIDFRNMRILGNLDMNNGVSILSQTLIGVHTRKNGRRRNGNKMYINFF